MDFLFNVPVFDAFLLIMQAYPVRAAIKQIKPVAINSKGDCITMKLIARRTNIIKQPETGTQSFDKYLLNLLSKPSVVPAGLGENVCFVVSVE